MIPRQVVCAVTLAAAAISGGAFGADVSAAPPAKPNILILIADDATCSDLPLFGGNNVQTPNIDRLAGQGMLFTRAYVGMAMCVPCRTELYTGLYPMRSGVCWNHSLARPGTRSIVHHLGKLGYRVGISGKIHVAPRDSFPFKRVPGCESNCVAATAALECDGLRRFMTRDPEQPFCLCVGLVVPHAPWTVGDPSRFPPQKIRLPVYLADTRETRSDFARYLAELEVLDQQVGEVMKLLNETGHTDRTLVVFSSEQGAQFPGCKWTNWEQGLHTALVVCWPGKVAAGSRSDALVQFADVLPTLIEAAGGAPESYGLDGSSFLPVLLGRRNEHRRYVYALHNNVPEGPPYPIRSVRDSRFRYIRNLNPERLYIEKHLMGPPDHTRYWPDWMSAASTDAHALAMVHRYLRRPAEELYYLPDDPFEMRNLAEAPQYAEVKVRLSAELDDWMRRQGDPGAEIDTLDCFQANLAGGRGVHQ